MARQCDKCGCDIPFHVPILIDVLICDICAGYKQGYEDCKEELTKDKKNVAITTKGKNCLQLVAGDGNCKAMIEVEENRANIYTTENGSAWSGAMLNEENLDNIIAVCRIYKRDIINRK